MVESFDRDNYKIGDLAAKYSMDTPKLFSATSYQGVDFVLEGVKYQEEFLGSLSAERNPGSSKPAVYLSREAYHDQSKVDNNRLLVKTPFVGKDVVLDKKTTVKLFNDLITIDSTESIKEFISIYGRLRQLDGDLLKSPMPILCDTVREWIDFITGVKTVLRVWNSINKKKYEDLQSGLLCFTLYDANNTEIKAEGRAMLEARSSLACLIDSAFKDVKIQTSHKILPNGQIISLDYPLDLYSFVWKIIADSIKNTRGEVHIRKCYFCGAFHDEQDMVYMRVKANPSIGKVWYSTKCKDVDKMRRYREKKNKELGREAKPRPGARKF